MSKKKDKTTKLIDRFEKAVRAHARKESEPPAIWDDIDEELFLTKSHLQFYFDSMRKQLSKLENEKSGRIIRGEENRVD